MRMRILQHAIISKSIHIPVEIILFGDVRPSVHTTYQHPFREGQEAMNSRRKTTVEATVKTIEKHLLPIAERDGVVPVGLAFLLQVLALLKDKKEKRK